MAPQQCGYVKEERRAKGVVGLVWRVFLYAQLKGKRFRKVMR
jgi:hypothetical protein